MAAIKPQSIPPKTKLKPISSRGAQTTEIRHGKIKTESARKLSSAPTTSTQNPNVHARHPGRRVASGGNVTGRSRQRRLDAVGHQNKNEEEHENNGGQDIRFIDVPSEGEMLGRPSSKCQTLSSQEILEVSQESKYENVYEVNIHAADISTMPSLDKFTNLRLLDLSCNSIKQIASLHHNKDLKELKLYGNELTTISNLESLVELHTLHLQYNRIQSVGQCLACLKKLKILRLDSNRLKKLETREIASCSQLTFLDISNNRIDSLTSLNCLSALEELHATHNGLRAVTDISRCKKLNEVNLSYNRLSEITGIKGLPHLTILHLSHTALTTSCLKTLGKLRSLQNLDVSFNQLTDVNCIPELFPSLEVLNVSDNRIQRWSSVCSFAKCGSLSELYLSGNPFCSEEGEKQSYHGDLQGMMPKLEILDGAHVKRSSTKSAPVMRPMTATSGTLKTVVDSALSARQVENQLQNVERDLASFGASLAARFESVRSTMETLPLDPPSPRPGTALSIRSVSTSDGSRPGSRCNSRSRIFQAQTFATKNF